MQEGTLPRISNLSSYEEQIEFLDADTNQPINLSICADIIVTVSPTGNEQARSGFRRRGGIGLMASLTGGGITMSPDYLSVTLKFNRSQVQSLPPQTYEVGCRLIFEDDVSEQQTLLGYLPVVEGL